jgi:hypothetical protein
VYARYVYVRALRFYSRDNVRAAFRALTLDNQQALCSVFSDELLDFSADGR